MAVPNPSKTDRRATSLSSAGRPGGRALVGLLVKNSLSVLVGVLLCAGLMAAGWGGGVPRAVWLSAPEPGGGGLPR
eukprot:15764420-Heterocapsa_arctica.AAC.1